MPNERAIGNIEIVESSGTAFNSKNYLLAIGIDKYFDTKIRNLNTAVDDVEKIAALLVNKFGFENRPEYLLFNEAATKQNINDAFVKLLELFDKNPNQDNLIVYFAGHGDYDKRFDIGYRIPVEATLSQDSTYIEDSAILDRIKRLKAKHVLLISDSCFSGSMVRALDAEQYTFEEKSEALPSRHILTSGLLEEVDDGFRNDNSPFAKSILHYLQTENRLFIPFSDVAQFVKKAVPQNSQQNQVPYYGKLRTQGDFFGEFVLRTKNVELNVWNALDKNSLTALNVFMERYPESTKKAEAQKNIDRIKAETQQLKLETEKRAYENAKANPTIYNLNQFIKDYPKSSFASEMEDLLADAEENAAWKEAKNKNTITGYRLFLRSFPNTNLKDDAQKRIEKIERDVDSNESERLLRNENEEHERLAKIETDKRERENLAKLEIFKFEPVHLEKLELAKQERERLAKIEAQKQEIERVAKQKTQQPKSSQTQKISTKTITWSSVLTFLAFAAYIAFKFGFFAPKTIDTLSSASQTNNLHNATNVNVDSTAWFLAHKGDGQTHNNPNSSSIIPKNLEPKLEKNKKESLPTIKSKGDPIVKELNSYTPKQSSTSVEKELNSYTPTQSSTPVEKEVDKYNAGLVYTVVEQKPEFPNGEAALFNYLSSNIKYPAIARQNGIQGTVYIGFLVNTDGSIQDVTIKRGVGGGCSEEAIRIVQSMPKWRPGRQQGRAVRVAYTVPVKFKLE